MGSFSKQLLSALMLLQSTWKVKILLLIFGGAGEKILMQHAGSWPIKIKRALKKDG